jgi:RHS repeat-associated protein
MMQSTTTAGTGLDYFGARYLSSAQGRFTSIDPVTITPGRMVDPQQLNQYAYVRNNPLRLIDPTGEDLKCTGDQQSCLGRAKEIAGERDQEKWAMKARPLMFVLALVIIRQGTVLSADTESKAPAMLLQAAKEDVRTWRFAPDVTDTCEVIFIYDLAEPDNVIPQNPRIEMQLPSFVKITARPVIAVPNDRL